MPYKRVGKCVHKLNPDGSVGPKIKGGCHKTAKEADAHVKALYKNVKDAQALLAAVESSNKQAIRLYYKEGDRAPDGRIIVPGATNFNRPPPLPISLQTARSSGHEGAVIAGAVTQVGRFGDVIVGDGFIDMTQASGKQLVQLALNGTMQTWSPDLGDAKIRAVPRPSEGDMEEEADLYFLSGTLLGFVVCQLPAMGTAVFELLDDEGNVVCRAPSRGPQLSQEEPMPTPTPRHSTNIAACAGPDNPPAEWFEQPENPQRFINIEDNGRVSFMLAPAGGCHIGYKNMCVTPPDDDDFSYFHHGQVQTAEGEFIATGPVALRGGHAPEDFSAMRAQAHYDDPSTGILDVRVGYDEEGNIWAAGRIRPDATEHEIRRLRASGVSGDWRLIDGKLRLIGICSVNTPGFPKIRLAASGAEEDDDITVESIIGMGTDPNYNEDCEDCFEVPTLEETIAEQEERISRLEALVAMAGLEDRVFEELRASVE